MRTIVLIAAEERELTGFMRRVPAAVRLGWPLDFARATEWHGCRYLLLANGAGPRLAGQAADEARQREELHAMVSTGYCGALDRSLKPGEIFVARNLMTNEAADGVLITVPKRHPECRTGTVHSADRVIGSVAEKEALRRLGSDAVEMECAGLAPRAAEWNVPLHCVRAVTDTADEGFFLDFNKARDASGRIRPWRVVRSALQRPGRGLPELVRLDRRCRKAANTLGAFLANCHF